MVSRSSAESVRELTWVSSFTTTTKSRIGRGWLCHRWFYGSSKSTSQHLGCPQRQVQRKPSSRITHIAPDQLADPPQSVRERVAVDAEPMRGIGV